MDAQEFLLNEGCHCRLLREFIPEKQAATLLNELIETLPWQQEDIILFGKRIKQPRLTTWFGKGLSAESRYASSIAAVPWTDDLQKIKQTLEQETGRRFNSALVNYYRHGQDSMGMHSDDEAAFGKDPVIGTFSLGATRAFKIRHKKTEEKLDIPLPSGSMLVTDGAVQEFYKHGINKTKRPLGPRISITFRNIVI